MPVTESIAESRHEVTPDAEIRVNNFGDPFIRTEVGWPCGMPVTLVMHPGGIALHFRTEAVPLSQCVLKRCGASLFVHINLEFCAYNGVWEIPAAAYDALRAYGRAA